MVLMISAAAAVSCAGRYDVLVVGGGCGGVSAGVQASRMGMKNIGIAENVFPTEDGLALMPYHREGRRIEGEVLFTVDCAARPYDVSMPLYRTGIAVGNYAVDHHHGRYSGTERLPDLHFRPIPSFNVPMGCLRPAGVDNLLVADKPVSVTNIMNGATRV